MAAPEVKAKEADLVSMRETSSILQREAARLKLVHEK